MQAAVSDTVADDLMAIRAHLSTCPSLVPGNLVAAVSWHAIGELYHVSRWLVSLWGCEITSAFQRNALRWEHVDPPWMLPDDVGILVRALQDTKAWIASGGIVEQVVVAPPLTLPLPLGPNDGKSEVGVSDEELPSPRRLVSKVRRSDNVEHILDKGVWAGTGAMRRGGRIFVKVRVFLPGIVRSLISRVQDKLMMRAPICQCCRTLRHEYYGLAVKACGQCQRDKKPCQDLVVEGESSTGLLNCPLVDAMVVDPRPVAPCRARQTVAPVDPPIQPQHVATKGKAASHPTTRPQPRKVTRVASPTPDIVKGLVPTPSVAGPSRVGPPVLFEGPVISSEDGVRRDVAMPSGE